MVRSFWSRRATEDIAQFNMKAASRGQKLGKTFEMLNDEMRDSIKWCSPNERKVATIICHSTVSLAVTKLTSKKVL